jgi:hypothetical protein
MNQEKWEEIQNETATKMRDHIEPFVTPISIDVSGEYGKLLGSGSYFEVKDRKYVITNEHVARYLSANNLIHKFFNSDVFIKFTNDAIINGEPVDVAIIPIEDANWNACSHKGQAIPLNRFAQKHDPVEHELLLFAGYSGERSKFYFDCLFTPGTPYATQKCPFPTDVLKADPKYHFSLFYKPDLARSVGGKSNLPEPHGFSGSLVWDTKRIACLQSRKEWSPELAQVTGIIWGWPSSKACVLATKVEYFRLSDKFE